MKLKKATSKRERKYGKKDETGVQTKRPAKREKKKVVPVKVIVDGYQILEFPSRAKADEFITAKKKIEHDKRLKPTSYVFI